MSYVPRMKLRAHQVKARELSRGKRLFAYLCEMGTGKSAMILVEWAERVVEGRCHDLLILAPAGSYLNWIIDKDGEDQPSEIRKHLSPELFKKVRAQAWVSGAGKLAKEQLRRFLGLSSPADEHSRPLSPSRPRIFVVNIEALSSTADARKACIDFLSYPNRRSMMIVDESTTIKNADAIRTREVMTLRDMADLRRILTGMISPRSPLDLYSQFEFLDWRILGHETIVTFKRRYCILDSSRVPIGRDKKGKVKWRHIETIVGYYNLEELQKKIAPYSYRVLKSECLDLPAKIYAPQYEVELTNDQRRMYNDLVLYSTAELREAVHVTTNMVITKMLRLHQLVCGHTVDDDTGEIKDVPSNRIAALMQILEEHAGKVVIWVNYRQEIKKIVAALEDEYGKGSVAQFHGGNKKTRGNDEADFLRNPLRRFMVSTQSAGGRGNTWVNANLVIYFSNSYDLEMRMQSEDRSHRDGLKHAVTYVDLVAPRTVDEKILKVLRKKLNMTTLISGENYREWLI